MPVLVDSSNLTATLPGRKVSSGFRQGASRSITIGLINNMPDEALKATERQFLSLLDSASDGMQIRLLHYMLPDVPRQETARRYLNSFYASVEDLWDGHLDGLIVTGREPLASNLKQEPYWESFTRLAEWAESNTYSTVWSCLAAHAAVLHLDGIVRVRRNDKLFGIFECARAAEHPLTSATPSRFRLPHSRWNGAPEEDLTACGIAYSRGQRTQESTPSLSNGKNSSSSSRGIRSTSLTRCCANIVATSGVILKERQRHAL
jgi:homoserine O-succinyltransferase